MPARSHPDQIPALRDAVDAACTAAGRDPATLGRTVGVLVEQRPSSDRPSAGSSSADPLTGSPADVAAALRDFAAEGISHAQLIPTLHGLAGVEALAPVLNILDGR
jgi:alkanesulfonate monooxygenase SsuD/methylene tetrahydromethanopterin reductase-like flavin-dependent oxidoreductase (luciferase family)